MKLEQEQIKRLALAVLLLVALLYGYFTYLLGPVQQSAKNASNGIDAIIPQISNAKAQITKTADLEKQAPQAVELLNNLKNTIPDGAPIAWFPPKMTDFFHSHGIDKCIIRMVSEGGDAMPGFKKMVWTVDMPKVEFVPLGMAISSLENDEPLTTITDVTIDATREDAQYQHATLTITTLVKS
jgi:hypothetical protein